MVKINEKKRLINGMLLVSVCFIFYMTMFPNRYLGIGIEEGGHNFIPFLMIKEMFVDRSFFTFVVNNIGNIALFMPLGFFLPMAIPKFRHVILTTVAGCCLSAVIESIQWFMKYRWSDVDDIILNTIGALAGFGIYKAVLKAKGHISISL
ncbi:VanZ family protein [Niallia taxi]|uniref:VanZ family protein n=1 Tax=Niallia taxi TaxID=2499688 RepID=UPI0015F6813C|nr:VanZ family protein [Niallia taxi]